METYKVDDLIFTLKHYAEFVKENYGPWKDWHEDDIATYFLKSVKNGSILTIYIGSHLAALYEYWTITPRYLKVLKAMTGEETFPLPQDGDREGEIIFFPMAIISQRYRHITDRLTRMMRDEMLLNDPDLAGVYRWVLSRKRLRFMPFKKKEGIKEK